jgi:hypothetical protein
MTECAELLCVPLQPRGHASTSNILEGVRK